MGKKKVANKKRILKKKSADAGLAVEQFWGLDKDFYENYPREFFLCRLNDALIRIGQPEKTAKALNGTEIKIGKMTAVYGQDDYEKIERYAKIELFEIYIHCMESFLRLFCARAMATGCDWLAMTKMSIPEYHKALSKIVDNKLDWFNNKMNGDTTVVYALTGMTEIDEKISPEVIKNWKDWIFYCAYELSKAKAYNAYKHGLAIHATVGGFTLQPEGEDIELGREGDIISYLTTSEKEERYIWVKQTEFIDLDNLAYKIFVYGQLICSMINTGRQEHGHKEEIEKWYPSEEAVPNLGKPKLGTDIQSLFQAMDSFSVGLMYYKD